MKNINWDAYELFMQVARHGGLSGGAIVTGLSPATIGRRMLDLEEAIGRPLFLRSRTGYRLTAEGSALFAQILEMEGAARRIESWKREGTGSPLVRVACGTWLAWMFARNFSVVRTEQDRFRLDFYIAERRASLAHRESDIGIRAFEPQEPNLAAVKLGEVAYAAYRARSAHPSIADRWLAVSEEDAISAYLRWPHENRTDQVVVTVNRPRSLRDLALAGAGTAVLPCFVGDQDMRLERVGEEIAGLRHSQWIVMNNDDRHRREIRTVVDRMVKFIRGHAELFAGRRP
ncbi:DNA-binding transcriptional LysR family regulator [Rhizobium petrolearium]|uniref:LysR family transcriptional regulator n=1 Tax=Neorhizobium petrolearium TaxID=515361 RepID=UPI001AE7AD39|nr:LysR family transcriptional regulator [Neorhizobium petrolearium]MBP1842188.1 DNA-binding transcriptional LysR family regulator [Neorhizobium petrolearium]